MNALNFNFNEYVRVQLTDHGKALHRKRWDDLFTAKQREKFKLTYSPPTEDADGWSSFQLWELMQIFGPHISLGYTMPFASTIQIPLK